MIQERKRVSGNNVGLLLAVLAGVLLIGLNIWPAISLGAGTGPGGMMVGFGVGAGFLVAAFLADRNPAASKGLLFLGAVVLLGWAFLGRSALEGERGEIAMAVGLVPAFGALIAAFLIGPVEPDAVP